MKERREEGIDRKWESEERESGGWGDEGFSKHKERIFGKGIEEK